MRKRKWLNGSGGSCPENEEEVEDGREAVRSDAKEQFAFCRSRTGNGGGRFPRVEEATLHIEALRRTVILRAEKALQAGAREAVQEL